jgi:LCP family protein required for cell wall assembly
MAKIKALKPAKSIDLKLSPIYSLILPGLFQLRVGNFLLGVLGMLASASVLSLGILFAMLFAQNQELFFTLLTNDQFLLNLEIYLGVLATIQLVLTGRALVTIFRAKSIGRVAKPILAFFMVLIFAVQASVAYVGGSYVQSQRQMLSQIFGNSVVNTIYSPHAAPVIKTGAAPRVNILLLGGDAGRNRWGLRPDSISVLSVNMKTGKTVIIGLPRNMQRVPFVAGSPMKKVFKKGFACGPKCLLNAIYTYAQSHPKLYSAAKYRGKTPGIEATREAVQAILGIKIPYEITIDMVHFKELVDAVGGITVCVPKRALAQDLKTVFQKGCQHMNGNHALLYSRTRYDLDDYGRMLKQRLIQKAIIAQINPIQLILNFQKITKYAGKYVSADIPQSSLGTLLALAMKARVLPVRNLELSPPKFNMIKPDFTKIRRLVSNTLAAN